MGTASMHDDDDRWLQHWMMSLPGAVQAVEDRLGSSLDLTRRSLSALWEVLQQDFALREPHEMRHEPELPIQDVPKWATRPGWRRERVTKTGRTLESMGHFARYYGECITESVPEAKWLIWRWGVEHFAVSGEGDVALTIPDSRTDSGARGAVFPLRDISVITNRYLADSTESCDVVHMFDMRVTELKEALRARDHS